MENIPGNDTGCVVASLQAAFSFPAVFLSIQVILSSYPGCCSTGRVRLTPRCAVLAAGPTALGPWQQEGPQNGSQAAEQARSSRSGRDGDRHSPAAAAAGEETAT